MIEVCSIRRRAGRAGVAWAIVASTALAGCGGSSDGASQDGGSQDDVSLEPLSTGASIDRSDGVRPEGFPTVLVRITEDDGEVCERCMWLAADRSARARGLMQVTDLGLDGMVFAYDSAETRQFWMKDTVLPLSITFLDGSGRSVGTADMQPCAAEPCARYGPGVPFTTAIEVELGRLDELGLGAGSVVELVGDCPAA